MKIFVQFFESVERMSWIKLNGRVKRIENKRFEKKTQKKIGNKIEREKNKDLNKNSEEIDQNTWTESNSFAKKKMQMNFQSEFRLNINIFRRSKQKVIFVHKFGANDPNDSLEE